MYKDHVLYRDLCKEYPIIERGEGVYLYDTEGKRYLDACGGTTVINIGYGVKEVVDAMAKQAQKVAFAHGSRFRTQPLIDLAERIADMAPPSLNKVWLVSDGSEANESALKLARFYHLGKGNTEKYKFVARWQSHHGSPIGALSMSGHIGQAGRGREFAPLLLDFPHIVAPYCYRCPLGKSYPDCKVACANDLERMILFSGPETISGFIAEPITSPIIAGLTPPPEYYPKIREICDKYDVLFVVDEVMNGFGRTGADFAIDHWGVVPDIITFGKGVSGGYSPLGGMIVADKIIDVLVEKYGGKFHDGHSFSGNPLSAAVGVAVLDIIKEKGLVERAKEMGNYLLAKLKELYEKHPTMGEIRGKGLMVGVEFVKDRATKEPFPPDIGLTGRLCQRVLEKGVFVYPGGRCIDGVAGDQIFIAPPLIISQDEIDEIVAALDESLAELEGELL